MTRMQLTPESELSLRSSCAAATGGLWSLLWHSTGHSAWSQPSVNSNLQPPASLWRMSSDCISTRNKARKADSLYTSPTGTAQVCPYTPALGEPAGPSSNEPIIEPCRSPQTCSMEPAALTSCPPNPSEDRECLQGGSAAVPRHGWHRGRAQRALPARRQGRRAAGQGYSQHSMGLEAACRDTTLPLGSGMCTRNTRRTRVFLRPMSVSPLRSSMSALRSFRIPAQSMLQHTEPAHCSARHLSRPGLTAAPRTCSAWDPDLPRHTRREETPKCSTQRALLDPSPH